MGQAGHNFVKSSYDIQKLNDQLVRLYKDLLPGEEAMLEEK